MYRLTGEVLGEGAYASVQTCVNIYTDIEYAVKVRIENKTGALSLSLPPYPMNNSTLDFDDDGVRYILKV